MVFHCGLDKDYVHVLRVCLAKTKCLVSAHLTSLSADTYYQSNSSRANNIAM